jgi:hypothetical protein
MAFPVSPANNATAVVNGITYVYSSVNNAWKRVAQPISTANTTSAAIYANGAFIQANAAFAVANSGSGATAASSYANSAFLKANSAYESQNTTGTYANSAYTQANTATTNAATADGKAVTAGSYANSSYTQANTATTNAATADGKAVTSGSYANSAYGVANAALLYANAAFIQANAAFAQANTGGGGTPAANTAIVDDIYIGNGSTTQFTLSSNVYANSIIVAINGIMQPNVAYTVVGSNNIITLSEAPALNDYILVKKFTGAGGSVTTSGGVTTGKSIAMAIVFGG